MNDMGKFAVPGAVVVAGLLIAGAVFWGANTPTGATPEQNGDVSVVLPITEDDHILGNRDAKITVIEYTDIDCPFCKQFHETMDRIIDEYGPTGEVAWVYRHFPLTSLHPDAAKHAASAECVAELGGETAFWDYIGILLANAPGNELTDPSRYGEFAAQVGVDEAALNACIAKGDTAKHVEAEFNTAIEAGGTGTPFNIIVVEGQEPIAFSSALPYEQMKGVIDQILSGE